MNSAQRAIILSLGAILVPLSAQAQPWHPAAPLKGRFFHLNGQTMPLVIAQDRLALRLRPGASAKGLLAERKGDPRLGPPPRLEPMGPALILPIEASLSAQKRHALIHDLLSGSAEAVWPVTLRGGHPWVLSDRVIVELPSQDPSPELLALGRSLDLKEVSRLGRSIIIYRVGPAGQHDGLGASLALQQSGLVLWAEPDFISRKEPRFAPNDREFGHQWHLRNTGQRGATPGADVKATQAWDISQGDQDTIIAILDDGFDLDHEDLAGKFLPGYDFCDRDSDPSGEASPVEPGWDSHGTSCAGVAAANTNNSLGVAGACPQCAILPIRLIACPLYESDEAQALQWAVDRGAAILSNSWGPPEDGHYYPLPSVVRRAIDYAVTEGRGGLGSLVLFAAGNGGIDVATDGYASYANVVAVAASTDHDTWAAYSNFGAEIDIAAPSNGYGWPYDEATTTGIWTTDYSGSLGYNYGSSAYGDSAGHYTNSFGGTSSACPLAAGVAALILSANTALRWDEAFNILLITADKIDPASGEYDANGHSIYYGYGRINALQALLAATNQGTSGGIGDPCELGCSVPYCLQTDTGEYCTDDCLSAANCPEGFECLPVSDGQGGSLDVCVYTSGSCVPTTEVCDGVDNDCDGEVDEGGICNPGCQGETYQGRCDGDTLIFCEDDHVITVDCQAFGLVCEWLSSAETYDCQDPNTCTPTSEVCDGMDNDCDGSIDEGNVCCGNVTDRGRCEGNTLLVCDDGQIVRTECTSGQTCAYDAGLERYSCLSCTPQAEVCDGLDNDCDGLVDEGSICEQGCDNITDKGVCEGDVLVYCQDDRLVRIDCASISLVCGSVGDHKDCLSPGACQPQTEICDGADNDCDGAVDEGDVCCQGVSASGECRGDLLLRCQGELIQRDCAGEGRECRVIDGVAACVLSCLPSTEICDGADNDCDGAVDEEGVCGITGCQGETAVGRCDQGMAVRCDDGYLIRVDCDALGATCAFDAPLGYHTCTQDCRPVPEVCDGADNDCDGAVDEDSVCQGCDGETELGRCEGTVLIRCVAGNLAQTDCLGLNLTCGFNQDQARFDCIVGCVALSEICNGLDDDCDGLVDEDDACCLGVGVEGQCEGSTLAVCVGGQLQETDCAALGQACGLTSGAYGCIECGKETCDGGDNDCDGLIDEEGVCCLGIGEEGQCNGSILSRCVEGRLEERDCATEGLSCGPDDVGFACLAIEDGCGGLSELGECLGSLRRWCEGGVLQEVDCGLTGESCIIDPVTLAAACVGGGCMPFPEACDGLDNDCDGIIDEDDVCFQGSEKVTGASGCQMGGPGDAGLPGALLLLLLAGALLGRRKVI